MANLVQLRMLEELDGFLLVDKPEGIAFSTVVKTVKRKFNLVKVGHGGSLDAMASGLMVLLINDANKFVDRVMGADRGYTGTIRFGLKTDTGDAHGRTLAETPLEAEIPLADATLAEFRGDVFQTEPRFSAVRREGSAEYEIADTGEHTQFLAHVYRLGFDAFPAPGRETVGFSLSASKGVLPRSLALDLGDSLGCGATLMSLCRRRVGKFDLADAVPFSRLLETEIGDFPALVKPLREALV